MVVCRCEIISRSHEIAFLADVLGHTHVPMAARKGRTLVVNPGSIGEGRGSDPERSVSYAVLDTDSEEVEIVRFPNPRTAGR